MLSADLEIALKDITRRLTMLMEQVEDGDLVDDDLLAKLNEVSEICFIKYNTGEGVTAEDLELMTDLLSLLELRTTLIYKK